MVFQYVRIGDNVARLTVQHENPRQILLVHLKYVSQVIQTITLSRNFRIVCNCGKYRNNVRLALAQEILDARKELICNPVFLNPLIIVRNQIN